jgi:hypothetical protein
LRLRGLLRWQTVPPGVEEPGEAGVSPSRQQGDCREKGKAGAHMRLDGDPLQVLVCMDGIKQHHPGYLVRIGIGKDPDGKAPMEWAPSR